MAVIDDGIDGFQDHLTENIVAGVSYCRYSHPADFMNAYYVPSDIHGTVMATLICVCPKVKLYVARLDEYNYPSSKRQITVRSAAQVRKFFFRRFCLI